MEKSNNSYPVESSDVVIVPIDSTVIEPENSVTIDHGHLENVSKLPLDNYLNSKPTRDNNNNMATKQDVSFQPYKKMTNQLNLEDNGTQAGCLSDNTTNISNNKEQARKSSSSTKISLRKLKLLITDHLTLVSTLVMIGIIFVLMISAFVCLTKHYQYKNICLTQTCVTEASKIISSLDESIDPCEDFYQFVCGQWLNNTVIPEHKPLENKFDELHDILNRQVRAILEEGYNEKDEDFVQNMKIFYNSCMNVSEIDRKGSQPLINIIHKLGGWPVLHQNWSNANWSLTGIHTLLNDLGIIDDMLIPLIITSNDKNNSRNILAIKEPSFGLMSREFMIKDFNDTTIRSYFNLMLYSYQLLHEQLQMFSNRSTDNNKTIHLDENAENDRQSLLPINQRFSSFNREFTFEGEIISPETDVYKQMRDVLKFEQDLAFNSLKKEERTNVSRLFNNMTIGQLQTLSPNINWLEIINIFTPNDQKMTKESEIVVIDVDYVQYLSEIIPKTDARILANYIIWRVIKSKIGVLDSTWRRLKQTYNSINLGHSKIEPRWMQCVGHTHATLGTALSNVYVKNYFSIKEKAEIDQIVWQIRFELNQTIANANWMDAKTREEALDKLNLMNFRIGFPDEILDDNLVSKFYENLTLTNDYFENVIAIHRFEVENAFKSLSEINSRDDWRKYSEVVDVNAYYFHQENSFILNAGILQNRFFNPKRPNYLNYGSIGEIIGHEITHGFDSIGKQFDKLGQLRNWWQPITNQMYEDRALCMVNQYNQYYFNEIDMNINGAQTKDENIADNIGVTLAYRAYKRAYQYHLEQHLPGLNYNPEQLFWISYGLENCEKMTNEMLKLTIQIDTHAPGKFRLNGVVSNSKHFAEDFQCSKGSIMNPKIKCQVW